MKEYIEREALLQDISETVLFTVRGGVKPPTPEMRGANKITARIMAAPIVDAVEVVRCKDCIHLTTECCTGWCSYHDVRMCSMDFCSYGERKDEE